MGYASLEPHLPSSHAPLLPPGIFLSITDTQASDGNFLLHHFISNYIKADHHVVLVGLAGILVHYTMIGRKLGVNLTAARTKGNFQFVDGLTQLTDYAAPNKQFLVKPAETKPTATPAAAGATSPAQASELRGAARIAKSTGSAGTAAVTPPIVLSYSPKLSDFYKLLEGLVRNTLTTSQPAEEVSQDGLVKGVLYEADYIIDVRGLDSGGSRDVHGQRSGEVKENEWPALTLHYKILDNNHYASRAGNKEICTLLLNAGADVDARTPELGTTPLMRAVQQSHFAIVRLLVSYGASLEQCNADQQNVFHILAVAAALRNERDSRDPEKILEMVRWISMKVNASAGRLQEMLGARDTRGQTPMEYLRNAAQDGATVPAALIAALAMSDSNYCQIHWRDADLRNVETEWESEELPDDVIDVPLSEQPAPTEENEQAFFEQQILEMEQKWTDQDLPSVVDPRDTPA
ncbi:Elongator subunit elp6 [Dissophora globulifera]|uniref:Elongator subunit elp6 n=1 Tax=Dissophora globulifera TaxID=979702 RepID=A0A9P6RQD8_9FUNG|nr:Elongator subunit elp6 [Dissophora globulifera]